MLKSLIKTYDYLQISNASFIAIYTNVFLFMIVQTIFFWFIASKNIENIIDNKSAFIISLIGMNETEYVPNAYMQIISYILYNLLGLDKPPSETKVVVAMSGGVDFVRCCRFDENEWLSSNWHDIATL